MLQVGTASVQPRREGVAQTIATEPAARELAAAIGCFHRIADGAKIHRRADASLVVPNEEALAVSRRPMVLNVVAQRGDDPIEQW